MTTKAELRNRVLRHLKVIEANESPTAADAAVTEDAIDDVYAELGELGHAYWTEDAIPEACLRPLMRVVAADMAADFVTAGEVAEYESKRAAAMAQLRAVLAEPDDGSTTPAIYF